MEYARGHVEQKTVRNTNLMFRKKARNMALGNFNIATIVEIIL